MTKSDSDYFLDNYGLCKLDVCLCIKPKKPTSPLEYPPWLGRGCPNWQPAGALTADDLLLVKNVFDGG